MRIFAIFCTHGIPYTFFRRLLLVVLCPVFLGAAALQGEEIRAPKAAILVSQNIRPYIEAVEGMSVVLAETASAKVQVFSLERFKGKSQDVLTQSLTGEKFDLFVAVGPEAVRFVREEPALGKTTWLYSMILNPPRVSGQAETACGIPLDIRRKDSLRPLIRGLRPSNVSASSTTLGTIPSFS